MPEVRDQRLDPSSSRPRSSRAETRPSRPRRIQEAYLQSPNAERSSQVDGTEPAAASRRTASRRCSFATCFNLCAMLTRAPSRRSASRSPSSKSYRYEDGGAPGPADEPHRARQLDLAAGARARGTGLLHVQALRQKTSSPTQHITPRTSSHGAPRTPDAVRFKCISFLSRGSVVLTAAWRAPRRPCFWLEHKPAPREPDRGDLTVTCGAIAISMRGNRASVHFIMMHLAPFSGGDGAGELRSRYHAQRRTRRAVRQPWAPTGRAARRYRAPRHLRLLMTMLAHKTEACAPSRTCGGGGWTTPVGIGARRKSAQAFVFMIRSSRSAARDVTEVASLDQCTAAWASSRDRRRAAYRDARYDLYEASTASRRTIYRPKTARYAARLRS